MHGCTESGPDPGASDLARHTSRCLKMPTIELDAASCYNPYRHKFIPSTPVVACPRSSVVQETSLWISRISRICRGKASQRTRLRSASRPPEGNVRKPPEGKSKYGAVGALLLS